MAVKIGTTTDPESLYGQPVKAVPSVQGSTPTLQNSPAPAIVAAPRATPSAIQDFSKDYGLFNGAVYDKKTNIGFSSDAEFKTKTGFSSNGQKFDKTYIPPSSIPPLTNTPIGSADLERSTMLPEVSNFVTATAGKNLSETVTAVAASTLDANKQILDQLYKQQEDLAKKEKDAAAEKVAADKTALNTISSSTQLQDTLKTINEKFDVENKIKQYSTIQQGIVDAQEALDMGLIYEADRPARMGFISGRSASLMKQGLAKIGALQGTAAVLKGDIDTANAYATQTLNAIKDDQQRQWNALTNLLNLDNQNLVTLTAEEKSVVSTRLKLIGDEIEQQDKNKDDVLGFMAEYPSAFLAGGVTLTDTKEQALKKMLPKMAADERAKFEASITKTGGTAAQTQAAKTELLSLKSKGMTYDEAVLAYGDMLDLSYIAGAYGRSTADKSIGLQDQLTNAAYSKYFDANGNILPNYEISIDQKNGRPVVTEKPAEGKGWHFDWKQFKFTNQ